MTEEIYKDLTEKLLPKIQEGLAISKEYFLDIFGRYVKYLIISDIITIFLIIIALVLLGVLIRFFYAKSKEDYYDEPVWFISLVLSLGICLALAIVLPMKVNDLIQDIYIPEVRIIQELMPYKKP